GFWGRGLGATGFWVGLGARRCSGSCSLIFLAARDRFNFTSISSGSGDFVLSYAGCCRQNTGSASHESLFPQELSRPGRVRSPRGLASPTRAVSRGRPGTGAQRKRIDRGGRVGLLLGAE